MTAGLARRESIDARLADEISAGDCPVCAERTRAGSRLIESILLERVTDRAFRSELDAARGFCPRHTADVLRADRASGSGAGAAILFGAVATIRLAEAEAALAAGGRSRARRIAMARRPAACPVCEHASESEATALGRLVDLARDAAWADAIAEAAFCLDHLLALSAAAEPSDAWHEIGERQLRRVRALRDRLRSFAHHSTHDRRHLITDSERASAGDGAALLGGATGRGADDGSPPER